MSVKSLQKLDKAEARYIGTLGWLSALSVAITTMAVGYVS